MFPAGLTKQFQEIVDKFPEELEAIKSRLEEIAGEPELAIVPVVPQRHSSELDATGGDHDQDTWSQTGYEAVSIVYDIPTEMDATLTLNSTPILEVTDGDGRSGSWDAPRGRIRVDELEVDATNNASSAQDLGVWILAVIGR